MSRAFDQNGYCNGQRRERVKGIEMWNLIKNLSPTQWVILFMTTASFLNGATAQLTDFVGPTVTHYVISGFAFASGLIGTWAVALTSQGSIIKQVAAMPGIDPIKVNANANATAAALAIDPESHKISPAEGAAQAVAAIAKAA
jgi:hypothetical protein